jgi:hypothetical protein
LRIPLCRFLAHKHNAKSCHGGNVGTSFMLEFGKIPDHLLQTPSVHSCRKTSHSDASNIHKGEKRESW